MHSTTVSCINCKTSIYIEENILFFETNKEMEKAFCPICKTILIEHEISGWLFVAVAESIQKIDQHCHHPMT